MRRRIPLAFVALIVATAAFGCGLSLLGSDAAPDGDAGGRPTAHLPNGDAQPCAVDGGGSTDGNNTPSNEDAGGDDGSSNEASFVDADEGDVITAPVEASIPASTPGVVMCDGSACTVPAQFCCVGKGTCESDPAGCGTYRQITCDEPLDCPTKCCLTRNSAEADNASTRCQADCSSSPGGVRVCLTSADCNGGAPCLAVQCLGATFGTCNGGIPPTCIDGGL